MHRLLTILILLLAALNVSAREAPPAASDPVLEKRVMALSQELRCLVCQNQSIDDSNAPLAKDLRVLVRDRLKANDSDQQVLDYIVARYGQFVLLKPPFGGSTLILWLTPIIVLFAAAWLVVRSGIGRPRAAADTALSVEERRKLDDVLKG